VEAGERLRLFVSLVLPEETLDRLSAWQAETFPPTPGVRLVPRENLHVTLAFLGHRPSDEVPTIMAEVREAAEASPKLVLVPRKYRETTRVGMIVLRDQGPIVQSAALAYDVQRRMEELGIPLRERSRWAPHVTVLRFRGKPPRFAPILPELETDPSEVAVMMSRLRPSGAEYEILESVSLGG
jgi:2'-5' RNA ligase